MINIAICDDEKIFASEMEGYLFKYGLELNISINTDVFYDGEELAEYIEAGNIYDLIFLDIEMKKLNGVDTAHRIRSVDKNVLIIYVTSHESYAKEVFEVSAFRFLTKPIELDLLRKYFLNACNNIVKRPDYFTYRYNKVTYRLPIADVMYFQSELRVTYIVTANGNNKCYAKLNNIEKRLAENNVMFYRTHQSFLVNPKFVTEYYYDRMVLYDGTTLSISGNRRKKVSELYCKLRGEEIIV